MSVTTSAARKQASPIAFPSLTSSEINQLPIANAAVI